jgi:hypothetical protein
MPSKKRLKRVSAEEFNKWYDEKRSGALKDTPKWNKKECSISWEYVSGGVGCMFSDLGGVVEYYIDVN